MTVLQLIDPTEAGALRLIPNPQRLSAMGLGEALGERPHMPASIGLLRLGARARDFDFRVVAVSLRHKAGYPGDAEVQRAEEEVADSLRTGDITEALASLQVEVPGHYLQQLTLSDVETGQQLSVSRYGAVIAAGRLEATEDLLGRLLDALADTSEE